MYLLVLTCSLHILRIRIYLLVCTCSLHILRMYLRVCICSLYILRMYLLVLNLFLAYSSYILACMIVYSDTRQVKSFSPIMTSSYFLITSSMYLSASLVLSFQLIVAGWLAQERARQENLARNQFLAFDAKFSPDCGWHQDGQDKKT